MAKKLSAADILAAAKAAPVPPPAPPKPVRKQHELRVEATDPHSIYEAAVKFWQTVVAVAQATLPADSWDVIICDLMDNGSIAATPAKCVLPFYFPQHLSDLDRREHAGRSEHFCFPQEWEDVSLYVAFHQQQLEEATERSEDDTEFDREFQDLVAAKSLLLRTSASDVRLVDQWQRLPQLLGAFAIVESYEFHESNLIRLLGELPQPTTPRTALEVFSRLLQHSHNHVGKNSLRFAGEELESVDLSGANTTDDTLALLAHAPNLRDLCQHLRQLDLTKSQVTDAACARLAAALPQVEILR